MQNSENNEKINVNKYHHNKQKSVTQLKSTKNYKIDKIRNKKKQWKFRLQMT